MSFKIIRDDITRVHADVIVNSANPAPVYRNGSDRAVYEAAGAEQLLEERKKIGFIQEGNVAVTKAYALPARYIIHTVGPAWSGGSNGEFEKLASCYRESLSLAKKLNCESIAFPLISAGVYGFPKADALQIALGEIESFLEDPNVEMEVILVVFNREAFEISSSLLAGIDQYIDEKYVENRYRQEHKGGLRDRRRSSSAEYSEDTEAENFRLKKRKFETDTELFPDLFRDESVSGEEESADTESDDDVSFLYDEWGRDREDSSVYPEADYFTASGTFDGLIPGYGEHQQSSSSVSEEDSGEVSAAAFEENAVYQNMTLPYSSDSGTNSAFNDTLTSPDCFPSSKSGKSQNILLSAISGLIDILPFGRPTRKDLQEAVRKPGESFQSMLLRLIDERNLTDPQVYKKANIDRKLFSKIRCTPDYKPKKRTALALAIALELDLNDTIDLLRRAELALSPASQSDLIIEYCIVNGIYNIYEINALLFEYEQPLLC